MVEYQSEFSRSIDLEQASQANTNRPIKATPEECQALAIRFNIKSISQFDCTISVTADATFKDSYLIEGQIHAKVTQSCVSTLKDVPETVDTDFKVRILHPRYAETITEEQEDNDDIEFNREDSIDVGEISAQYLALSLNPYPRSEEALSGEDDNVISIKPFGALESLITGRNK